MTKPTHCTGGLLCGCILGVTTPTSIPFLLLGSLLPDIDTGKSAIGRIFFWQSGKNHRCFFHSLLFLGIFIAGSIKWTWCIPAAIGIASHILLDTLNTMPIQLLFPSNRKLKFPWSKCKAGSIYELLILILMLTVLFTVFISPMQLFHAVIDAGVSLIKNLIPMVVSVFSHLWNSLYPLIIGGITAIAETLG